MFGGRNCTHYTTLKRISCLYFNETIGINIDDGGIVVTGKLGVIIEAGMDMTVQQVPRPRPPHQCQEHLKPGMGTVGQVVNAIRGGMGDQNI